MEYAHSVGNKRDGFMMSGGVAPFQGERFDLQG